MYVPVGMCGLSLLLNIAYVYWERRILPKQYRLTNARQLAIDSGKKGGISFKAILVIPWAFWMLPMTQLFQSEAAGAFGESSSDLIRMKGYTETIASYTASAKYAFPVVLSPFVGIMVDRYGHRFHIIAFAPLLWIMACAIIGWSDVHPLLPVIITIPLLLRDQHKLGTAFGIWRCFNNAGSSIMSIVVSIIHTKVGGADPLTSYFSLQYGIVQDRTANMAYTNVLIIGIAFKALDFFVALSYIVVDYLYFGKGMTMGEKKRIELEKVIIKEGREDEDPLTRRKPAKFTTYGGLALLSAMVVSAWVVFIKYTL
ncbi:MFS general substrate transporter [Pseudohyphozyma bogoriensis]|nr:MFS general substrate transporter [Pseudohyphozyma bogoriensis]